MKLKLHRREFQDTYTLGELFIDDEHICFTLEDKVRDKKIPGQTAIPYGTYKMVIDFSNRFQKDLPRLLNVPNFEGVRIHTGNTDKDTEGCILVGSAITGNSITMSKDAFSRLMARIKNQTELSIEIV